MKTKENGETVNGMPLPLIDIEEEIHAALRAPGTNGISDRRPAKDGGRSPGDKAKLGAALMALGKELTDAARAEVPQSGDSESCGVRFKPRGQSKQHRVNTAAVKDRHPRNISPELYFEKVLRPIVAVHLPFRTATEEAAEEELTCAA